MDARPDRHVIAGLLASLASGADAVVGARELAAAQRRCDRRDPVAARWLARWAPRPAAVPVLVPVPSCSCAAGRCGVCN